MKKNYSALIFLIVALCCCKNNSFEKTKNVTHDTGIVAIYNIGIKKLDELKREAMAKGDIAKYKEAKKSYFDNMQYDQLLYCSMIMANKYNYSIAYYDVYFALTHTRTGEDFKALDINTQNIGMYYLLRSYELGYKDAVYDIEEIIGENKPIPNSSYYFSPKKF